jgi:hypothetical protein
MTKAANPFLTDRDLREKLIVNLQELNELSIEEQKSATPVVVMNFMGSNFSNGREFEAEGGVRGLWRGDGHRIRQDNRLKQTVYDTDGTERAFYYFFPSWTKRSQVSALATLNRERKVQSANIIYEADENFEIQRFHNIGFYHDETDKKYDGHEHAKNIEGFYRVLPPEVFQGFANYLKANNWFQFNKSRQNVRINARYFIHENGLKIVDGIAADTIERKLVEALLELDSVTQEKVTLDPPTGTRIARCSAAKLKRMGVPVGRDNTVGPHIFKYCNSISSLAQKLSSAFDTKKSAKQRHEIFAGLSTNSLFLFLGPGLLFDLMPKDRLSEMAYFEIVINAAGMENPLRFKYGEIANRPLYEILVQMERILDEDEPDLRPFGDVESITTRKGDPSIHGAL